MSETEGKIGLSYKRPDTIERALAAMVVCSTLDEARERLADEGIKASNLALENWRASKAERYEEIRYELAPILERHIANDARSNAHLAAELERIMLAQLLKLANEGRVSAKDLSRATRDIAQTKAQNVEKMMTLEERPQHIVDSRTPAELIRGLEALGVAKEVDPNEEVIRVVRQIEPGKDQ